MNTTNAIGIRTSVRIVCAVLILWWISNLVACSGIGKARVRQIGQLPCFAIPDERETRKYPVALNGVTVSRAGESTYIWAIDPKLAMSKQGVRMYITPDQCIVYGTTPDGMETGIDAQPLKTGVTYTVFINASPRDGNSPIRGYIRSFCLLKKATDDIKVLEIKRYGDSC